MFKSLSLISGRLITKLMIGGCLMAIIPVVVLGGVAVYNAKVNIEKDTEQQILMMSKSLADMVDGVVTSESNAMAMLAKRESVIAAVKAWNAGDTQRAESLQQEMDRLMSVTESRYESIVALGKDATIFADDVKGVIKGFNIADRDYVKKTMQGQTRVDEVIMSKKYNAPVNALPYPVKDENGRIIGMVAGMLRVPFLAAKINEIKLGKTGYAYIVNREGLVIVYPDPQQVLKLNLAQVQGMEEVMRKVTAGEVGVTKYTYKGVTKYCGYAPVKINGWSVVVAVPIEEMQASVHATRNIIIIGIVFFAMLAAAAAYFAARAIVVPIQKASDQLYASAEQFIAASGEVASASQGQAQGASEQADAIERTSSTLEEMSSITNNTANTAVELVKAGEATFVLQKSCYKIIKESHACMNQVMESGNKAVKIVKISDEIAFQINLLALNAAVEAARAGVAGAGFAVVAEEVRNLAIRSAAAAKDTAAMIGETLNGIKEGASLVNRILNEFRQMGETGKKTTALILEVNEASREQALGIEQISKAVLEMNEVVQQNAANAEESASVSEEMNAQAVTMNDVIRELVDVIGGSNDGSLRRAGARMSATAQRRLPLPGSFARKDTSGPLAGTAAGSARASIHEQVIPFDNSDEYKDF